MYIKKVEIEKFNKRYNWAVAVKYLLHSDDGRLLGRAITFKYSYNDIKSEFGSGERRWHCYMGESSAIAITGVLKDDWKAINGVVRSKFGGFDSYKNKDIVFIAELEIFKKDNRGLGFGTELLNYIIANQDDDVLIITHPSPLYSSLDIDEFSYINRGNYTLIGKEKYIKRKERTIKFYERVGFTKNIVLTDLWKSESLYTLELN